MLGADSFSQPIKLSAVNPLTALPIALSQRHIHALLPGCAQPPLYMFHGFAGFVDPAVGLPDIDSVLGATMASPPLSFVMRSSWNYEYQGQKKSSTSQGKSTLLVA